MYFMPCDSVNGPMMSTPVKENIDFGLCKFLMSGYWS